MIIQVKKILIMKTKYYSIIQENIFILQVKKILMMKT